MLQRLVSSLSGFVGSILGFMIRVVLFFAVALGLWLASGLVGWPLPLKLAVLLPTLFLLGWVFRSVFNRQDPALDGAVAWACASAAVVGVLVGFVHPQIPTSIAFDKFLESLQLLIPAAGVLVVNGVGYMANFHINPVLSYWIDIPESYQLRDFAVLMFMVAAIWMGWRNRGD
jgi:hypothetical protein